MTALRTPRGRPDLKLAESYIPAAITFFKGVLYSIGVCWFWRQQSRWSLIPPIVMLYYDNVWPTSTFLDSTSLCVDVVAGTLVELMRIQEYNGMMTWIGLVLWAVIGAAHLMFWPANQDGSLLVAIGPILGMCLMATAGSSTEGIEGYWPFACRASLYLLLSIIDIYALRPPMQRERDKVCMLRYGSILVAPMIPSFLVCGGIGIAGQVFRLYCEHGGFEYTSAELSAITVIAPPRSTVDNLAFEEAFRLAKLQYQDGKSSY